MSDTAIGLLLALGRAAEALAPLGWRVVEASAGAGVLALATLAVTRSRFAPPPRYAALLWWLVAARAIASLAFALPLPVLPASPGAPTFLAAPPSAPAAPVRTSIPPAISREGAAVANASTPPSATAAGDRLPSAAAWSGLLTALWLLGAAIAATRALGDLGRLRALERAAVDLDGTATGLTANLCARLDLRRAPRVATSADVHGPLVFGLWRPTVLLAPETPATEIELVLAHELLHVRHHDLAWGLIPALAERLFFFHPLVRLAAREYALAVETARDREVLSRLEPAPERYGRLLVRWGIAPRPAVTAAAAHSPTFHALRRRLQMLENRSRRLGTAGFIALAGAVLLAIPVRPVAAWSGETHDDEIPVARLASDVQPAAMASAPTAPSRTSRRTYSYSYLRIDATPPTPPPPPAPPMPSAPAAPPLPPPPPSIALSELPPVPPAPPMPPMPSAAARIPPAPPIPPVPPAPPRSLLSSDGPVDEFVLYLHGGTTMIRSGWVDHLRAHLRENGKDAAWFRYAGKAYSIADRATLERIGQLFEAQSALSKHQSELADQQSGLANDQAKLADKQAALADRQASAAESTKVQSELAASQDELAREQDELAKRQDELSRRQDVLAGEQDKASQVAAHDLQRLLEQAIADGTAKADD